MARSEDRDKTVELEDGNLPLVFVSYRSCDWTRIEPILKQIERETASRFRYWIDREDLRSGSGWDVQLDRFLRQAACVLGFLSKQSQLDDNPRRRWYRDELNFAWNNKKLVAIALDDVDPETLVLGFQSLQLHYLRQQNLGQQNAVTRICRDINETIARWKALTAYDDLGDLRRDLQRDASDRYHAELLVRWPVGEYLQVDAVLIPLPADRPHCKIVHDYCYLSRAPLARADLAREPLATSLLSGAYRDDRFSREEVIALSAWLVRQGPYRLPFRDELSWAFAPRDWVESHWCNPFGLYLACEGPPAWCFDENRLIAITPTGALCDATEGACLWLVIN